MKFQPSSFPTRTTHRWSWRRRSDSVADNSVKNMQSQQYHQNLKASFFCSFYCILDVGSGGLVLSHALFWLAQHVPAPAQQVSTQMKCQVLLLVYSHFLFPPLLRQQDDCDSDRRHRMKSEPLNPHISVDSTMKNVTILNFFVLSVPLLRQMDFALITVMCWCPNNVTNVLQMWTPDMCWGTGWQSLR